MINTHMTFTSDNSINNNTDTVKGDGGIIHTEEHVSGDLLDAVPQVPAQCFIQRRSRRRRDKANGKGGIREPLSPISFKSNSISLPIQKIAQKSSDIKANCTSGGKRPRRLIKSASSPCDTPPQPARSRTKKRVSQLLKFRSPLRDPLPTESSRSSFSTPCIPANSKLPEFDKENSEHSDQQWPNEHTEPAAATTDDSCYDCSEIRNSWSQRMENETAKYDWSAAHLNDKIPSAMIELGWTLHHKEMAGGATDKAPARHRSYTTGSFSRTFSTWVTRPGGSSHRSTPGCVLDYRSSYAGGLTTMSNCMDLLKISSDSPIDRDAAIALGTGDEQLIPQCAIPHHPDGQPRFPCVEELNIEREESEELLISLPPSPSVETFEDQVTREDHETRTIGGVGEENEKDFKRELNAHCNNRSLPVISDCAENRLCSQRQQTTPIRTSMESECTDMFILRRRHSMDEWDDVKMGGRRSILTPSHSMRPSLGPPEEGGGDEDSLDHHTALRLSAPFQLPHGYRKASVELACSNVLGIMGGREAVMDGSPSPTLGDPHPTHRSVNRRRSQVFLMDGQLVPPIGSVGGGSQFGCWNHASRATFETPRAAVKVGWGSHPEFGDWGMSTRGLEECILPLMKSLMTAEARQAANESGSIMKAHTM